MNMEPESNKAPEATSSGAEKRYFPLIAATATFVILLLGLGVGFSIPYGGPVAGVMKLAGAFSSGSMAPSASAAALPATTPAPIDKPSSGEWLKVTPEKWDFGEVKSTDVVKHTFQLKNTGSGEIIINSLTTSCGCTKAKVSKMTLAPGESVEMVVTYDPSHHSDVTPGPVRRLIYIRSNDPSAPEIVIPVTAVIVKVPATSTPESVAPSPEQGG